MCIRIGRIEICEVSHWDRMFRIKRLGFICIVFVLANVACAEREYRCSGGRVQSRPCTVRMQKPLSSARMQLSKKTTLTNEFAKIEEAIFKRISPARGQWSGSVRGLGRLHLTLLIFDGIKLVESRSMGSVDLEREKSTNFGFRSWLPNGINWSSKVVAFAEPIP